MEDSSTPASSSSSFLCQSVNSLREMSHDRFMSSAAMRPKQACPGTANVDAAGSRNAQCTLSAQTYFVPFWVKNGEYNSKMTRQACASSSSTMANASYTAK